MARSHIHDKHRDQEYNLMIAKETRLTALHERKKAEASIMVPMPEPIVEHTSKKDAIMHVLVTKPKTTPQEIASATGASLPYVYEVIRGSNGR